MLDGLSEEQFRQFTGFSDAGDIAKLIRELTEEEGPAKAEVIGRLFWEQLHKGRFVDRQAWPLTAVFLARMAIHHPLWHIQDTALELFSDLDIGGSDVLTEALQDATATMRRAGPDDDVSAAFGVARAVLGISARLLKEARRLEARSTNEKVRRHCGRDDQLPAHRRSINSLRPISFCFPFSTASTLPGPIRS